MKTQNCLNHTEGLNLSRMYKDYRNVEMNIVLEEFQVRQFSAGYQAQNNAMDKSDAKS